jgi:hypothetical protein
MAPTVTAAMIYLFDFGGRLRRIDLVEYASAGIRDASQRFSRPKHGCHCSGSSKPEQPSQE